MLCRQVHELDGFDPQTHLDMERLHWQYAASCSKSASSSGQIRAQVFDWNQTVLKDKFDVVLACDVLYEDDAVEPISAAVPRLLKSTGKLLLADPPKRTVHNRERFLQLLSQTPSASFAVDECSERQCEVNQLDPEMSGGVTTETIPVQFLMIRRVIGNHTVGVKLQDSW